MAEKVKYIRNRSVTAPPPSVPPGIADRLENDMPKSRVLMDKARELTDSRQHRISLEKRLPFDACGRSQQLVPAGPIFDNIRPVALHDAVIQPKLVSEMPQSRLRTCCAKSKSDLVATKMLGIWSRLYCCLI